MKEVLAGFEIKLETVERPRKVLRAVEGRKSVVDMFCVDGIRL